MDKIKILAAVLALAGCMENGMGMEENIEINKGNVILRSADTNEWNDKIEAAGFPELESIELRGIDFSEYSDLSDLNAVISMFDNVTFTECKNFPEEITALYNVRSLSFCNCNASLKTLFRVVCSSCYFEYLNNCIFTNGNYTLQSTDSTYKYMTGIFEGTTFIVN